MKSKKTKKKNNRRYAHETTTMIKLQRSRHGANMFGSLSESWITTANRSSHSLSSPFHFTATGSASLSLSLCFFFFNSHLKGTKKVASFMLQEMLIPSFSFLCQIVGYSTTFCNVVELPWIPEPPLKPTQGSLYSVMPHTHPL